MLKPPPPALTVDRGGTETSLSLGDNPPFHTTPREVQGERLIDVPGSTVRVALWDEVDAGGSTIPFYGISLDGVSMKRVRQTSYELKLRHGRFDPAEGARPVAASLRAPADSEVYIVQFVTQPLSAYRQALRDLGATIYKYLPKHAYLVRMTPAVKAQVEALDFVRWVGPFHPAYKMGSDLRADLLAQFSSDQTEGYSIMVQDQRRGLVPKVADRIRAIGGVVACPSDSSAIFGTVLTVDQLRTIVEMDEVAYIDVPGEIVLAMDIARSISGADYIETVEGFTGQGVRGEVKDIGLFVGHHALNPLIHGGNWAATSHGTPVYGIVFGDGTGSDDGYGNLLGRGVLPDATGYFSSMRVNPDLLLVDPDWPGDPPPTNPCLTGRKDHIGELVNEGLEYKCVFQTNSWGHTDRMEYRLVSSELDDAVFEHDIVICQAQGNTKLNISVPEAWAKNVLSVGGVHHFDVECRDDDRWCDGPDPEVPGCGAWPPESSSCACRPGEGCDNVCPSKCGSTGPASDGRVKPDLVHFYDNILTTCDSLLDPTCYTDNNPTAPFAGTSAATPITCGHIGLIFQMWHEGVFPGFGGGATVFDSRPHSSTARALAINTAYQYPIGTGQQTDMTRDNQGWGMIDVKNLYDLRNKLLIVDETDILELFGTKEYTICVQAFEPALRATLVYTDPTDCLPADDARINDLSLKVTSPSGDVYWGNNGLLTENWSEEDASESKRDTINTVENVFVQNPESGQWTITVSADEINIDGHVETSETDDVDFGLVVSGLSYKSACCLPPFNVCRMFTLQMCHAAGGTFHECEPCHTACFASQGPQPGP